MTPFSECAPFHQQNMGLQARLGMQNETSILNLVHALPHGVRGGLDKEDLESQDRQDSQYESVRRMTKRERRHSVSQNQRPWDSFRAFLCHLRSALGPDTISLL